MRRALGPFGHMAAGQFGFVKALIGWTLKSLPVLHFHRNSARGAVLQGYGLVVLLQLWPYLFSTPAVLFRPSESTAAWNAAIFSFIWKYSRREQLVLLAFTIITFPFLYATLELPKRIINDAIGADQ